MTLLQPMHRTGGANLPQPVPPEPLRPPRPVAPALETPTADIVEPVLPGHYPVHNPLRPVTDGIRFCLH
jgi:hypothetical protein